jgi:hypothetical protein
VCQSFGHVSCLVDQRFSLSVERFNDFLLNTSLASDTRVNFDVLDFTALPTFIRLLPVVKFLSVSGRRLAVIQRGVLDGMRLESLNFSHSAIHTVAPGAFTDLVYLRALDLSHNKLRVVAKSVFTNFPVLEELDLSHNQLEFLPLDASTHLPQLKVLMLSHNRLSYLIPGSLTGLPSLHILGLKNNSLRTLVLDVQGELPNIEVVELAGNPFHCSCRMEGFRRLLASSGSKLMDGEQVTCDTPLSRRGERVQAAMLNLSDCQEPKTMPMMGYDSKNVLYVTEVSSRSVCVCVCVCVWVYVCLCVCVCVDFFFVTKLFVFVFF